MFDIKANLYIKILIIVLLILIFFYTNKLLTDKINSYEKLITARQKEIKIENEYKKKYINLEERYDFKNFKKDEIIKNLNLIIDKNNIKIINMKTVEQDERLLVSLEITSKFSNINIFLDDISQEKSFYNLLKISMQKDMNYEDNLLVEIEILFNLSAFVDYNSNNSFSKQKYINLKNPYKLQTNKSDYVMKSNDKKIEMILPIKLFGIIIGEKGKLAIVEINNQVKSIKSGFNKFGVEVMDININNIRIKYKDLFFKIDLGGNKGVLQKKD